MNTIPFNKPFMTGKELWYISQAYALGHLSGNGEFTKRCQAWLEELTGAGRALLAHSCTAALEMAALLADIQPGDEIIMPSFTFVSTANAFVLRGGVPVFVDIRPDTLNIDETKIERAITSKTRAIVAVHYAGVSCEMDSIMAIARQHDLIVIEDAAQGILSKYDGKPLGSIGHLGAMSFHETKNVISGEGGALIVNERPLVERAEIVREKGTDRSSFLRRIVDKYTWIDLGSSYSPSEVVAAFLWAQMEEADHITQSRLEIWSLYHSALEDLEKADLIRRPIIPTKCSHNAHMYYIILNTGDIRRRFIETMEARGIYCVFHYVPLHSSPMGLRCGRAHESMMVTDAVSSRLVRLPLWLGLEPEMPRVISEIKSALS